MKTFLLLPILAFFCLFNFTAAAQDGQAEPDQLNLPGDNLNLYAVMKLFQESPTLEGFEKKLNDQSLKVNNLDLNGDNKIDYIKVIDNADGNTHTIALKVAVNESEDQDVAVFVVKKESNGQVDIQLIGDEALYGKDYIIEPNTGSSTPTPNPGYTGDQPPPPVDGDVYGASAWPVVQYMYVPSYSVWRSPYHWGYYPSYWEPWTPFFWHEYYGYQYHYDNYYRAHYRYTPVYRFPDWRDHYYGGGFRSRSTFVINRNNRGDYRQTYSRPDLANRGSDLFRRDHPRSPWNNRPLPKFDNNNNNRPIVDRSNRPGGDNSYNRPGNNNSTRPGTPNPGNSNNGGSNKPFLRPVTDRNNNNNGGNNNNGNNGNNNNGNRPSTRPATPAPAPAPTTGNNGNGSNKPFLRPVTDHNNNNNNGNNNRNNARPATPPANNNNTPNRPAGNGFPNRPIARPAAPPPQQQTRPTAPPPRQQQQQPPPRPAQPAARPANERPAREQRGNN